MIPDNARPHLARKRFLVKPALQLKSLGFMLMIVLLSSVGVYIVLESTLWNSLALMPLSDAQTAHLAASLRLSFFFMLAILLAACGLESYLFIHRIVGPLFALERELKRIAEGDLSHQAHLRTGDELQDIFKSMEQLKQTLKDRTAQETRLLEESERILEQIARELPSNSRVGELRKNIDALRQTVSRFEPRS